MTHFKRNAEWTNPLWQFAEMLSKFEHILTVPPSSPTPGYSLTSEKETYLLTKTDTRISGTASLIIARIWKQSKCLQ